MIKKVEIYKDEAGREVKSYSPLNGEGQILFSGKVRVKITPPPSMNESTPVFERDFEFPMPDDIQTVEAAFEKFDEICKKRLDERKDKILKKTSKTTEVKSEGC